ncbi:MAG: organoarsenical effux MFS transporter ArsJ [bacterium]
MSSNGQSLKQYSIVTANYWAFTLTDGALRMLVVLYFYSLGYTPLNIALLFLFYEFFGVVTNLVGGWLGARLGLNKTMNIGLGLQVAALAMLLVPSDQLSMVWVMAAQAISGIAKDLNKMSAKSSVKLLVDSNNQSKLYHWVAVLTGSKNTLKGVGFFMGGGLLSWLGFHGAILTMSISLAIVWALSLILLGKDMGKAVNKPRFKDIFSKSAAINKLSAARMFLFASRDVWFVVALPVFLSAKLNWSYDQVGGFIASWIIVYGLVQAFAPRITRSRNKHPDGRIALYWAVALALIPGLLAIALGTQLNPEWVIVIGLMVFGFLFAINSSLHSYLIVSYASEDGVSLDVGFYYMANAMGRLTGSLLSGWVYQHYDLIACLWVSSLFIAITSLISLFLPHHR